MQHWQMGEILLKSITYNGWKTKQKQTLTELLVFSCIANSRYDIEKASLKMFSFTASYTYRKEYVWNSAIQILDKT